MSTGVLPLFRIGDSYEAFGSDALEINKVLGLTLVYRGKGAPVASFPHSDLEASLHKLVQSGVRVAILERVSEYGVD